MDVTPLEFTGERFTPECVREIWYEHVHRYAMAAVLAEGKQVLDAACGEGYGSAMLAERAAQVRAIDVDEKTLQHARARYATRSNLQFERADVTQLDHLPGQYFDLICSFETLEHLAAQEAMLDGFRRLLKPQGLLLISTPDKAQYSDIAGFNNEFHVKELYKHEFESLLAQRFKHVRLFGQKLMFGSMLWEPSLSGSAAASTHADAASLNGLALPPMYWIAACSDSEQALRDLPALHFFTDSEESVYRHYEHEIRKNMAAGARIQELEAEVAQLRAQLQK